MHRLILTALITTFLPGCASVPSTPVPAARRAEQPGDVRGCIATYLPVSGQYRFEPFLKVASKSSLAEDGRPEVWGFRMWNLEPSDEKGLTRPVNVPEETFIPINEWKEVGPRKVRCPPYWRDDGAFSTER